MRWTALADTQLKLGVNERACGARLALSDAGVKPRVSPRTRGRSATRTVNPRRGLEEGDGDPRKLSVRLPEGLHSLRGFGPTFAIFHGFEDSPVALRPHPFRVDSKGVAKSK